jgi:hypothetical protein
MCIPDENKRIIAEITRQVEIWGSLLPVPLGFPSVDT